MEVVRTGAPTESARVAGYKAKSAKEYAFKLLQRPPIKKYIQQLRGAIVAQAEIDTLFVVNNAVDVLEACMAKDGDGKIDKKLLDSAGALKALDLLSKYTGGFDKNAQKNEHTGPGGGPILTADITPELKVKIEKLLDHYGSMRKVRK
jgi:hypothetical protein